MARKSSPKQNLAFLAPKTPSPELAVIVGGQPQARTEITRKVWDYIKRNGLQDQKVKTRINADERLRPVLGGRQSVTMFELTQYVHSHLR